MAELDRLDREYGLGAMPESSVARSSRRRGIGPVLPGLLITALILGGVIAVSPAHSMQKVRQLVGLGTEYGEGEYAFMTVQPETGDPVGYRTCEPIDVVVNPDGAPGNWSDLVDTAIDHISEPTGLEFVRVGTTRMRDFERSYDPSSGTYPPVLVAWATADEVPELEGDVAGIGGSAATALTTRDAHYVTGQVVLDADDFGDIRSPHAAQAIVDHEFGHLVGLDHVADPNELMHAENTGQTSFGPGDLEGLSILGDLAC